jgi:N-methylhydantoinase B
VRSSWIPLESWEIASLVARFCPGNQLADMGMKALAQAVPAQVSAGIGNLKVIPFSGMRGNSQWVHMEIFEGSYGGGTGWTVSTRSKRSMPTPATTPSRNIETHLPLRVCRSY